MTTATKTTVEIKDRRVLFMSPKRCGLCGIEMKHGDAFIRLYPQSVQVINPPEGYKVTDPTVMHLKCLQGECYH
jgi:hypothetical protein